MENSQGSSNNSDGLFKEAIRSLAARIARLTDQGELHTTAVPGLALFRRPATTGPICGVYEPSVCLIAQGSKRVQMGDETYDYDPHHYLLTSVHVPTVVQVTGAT